MSRFRGRGRVLTFIKNISLSLQLQGSYLCTISLLHSKEKGKLDHMTPLIFLILDKRMYYVSVTPDKYSESRGSQNKEKTY